MSAMPLRRAGCLNRAGRRPRTPCDVRGPVRDVDGREVDFVVTDRRKPVLIVEYKLAGSAHEARFLTGTGTPAIFTLTEKSVLRVVK